MGEYFEMITSQLTCEDMLILGILSDKQATAAYNSLRRSQLKESSRLSESNFRNALLKLQATCFIEVVTSSKEKKIYLTNYGKKVPIQRMSS